MATQIDLSYSPVVMMPKADFIPKCRGKALHVELHRRLAVAFRKGKALEKGHLIPF